MSANKRRTLAIKIETPGGDNPLTMQLIGKGPFFRGIAVSNLALVAKGGTGPYAFTILSGATGSDGDEINGLTLHTDGAFSGAPENAGRFTFVAQVSDAASQTYTHAFSLTFLPQLVVVAGTPTPGENLLSYRYQFIVRDLSGVTLTSGYSIVAGDAPDGLTLNTAGLLSGDPDFSAVGITYFTVRAEMASDFVDIPVRMEVFSPFLGFSVEDPVILYATAPFSDFIPTTVGVGGSTPYRYRWDNLTDFPWLKFDYASGKFSGTPPLADIGSELRVDGLMTDALGATVIIDFRFRPVYAQQGFTVEGSPFYQSSGLPSIGSSDGSVTIEQDTSGGLDFRATGGPGSGQAGIQFKDEGSNLGTSGTATSLNVVGAGAQLARVGNSLTLTVPGANSGVQSINGVYADSNGDIVLESPDHSVTIYRDSNGNIGFSVTPFQMGGAAIGVINDYTSAGTTSWSKPAHAKLVEVFVVGGGGGGGSGAGTNNVLIAGGSGGGGAARQWGVFKASDLASSVSLTVGAKGTGGAAVTAPTNPGNNGNAGGASSFGTYLIAYGGGAGARGQSQPTSGGGGGGPFGVGGAGSASTSTGGDGGGTGAAVNTTPSSALAFGGGGGGGTTTNTFGAAGGKSVQGCMGGGGGGCGGGVGAVGGDGYDSQANAVTGGTQGQPGNTLSASIAPTMRGAGGGGGGGKSSTSAGTNGGNGGAGQQPGGGGGGGGGSSVSGTLTGAGGDGGDGMVRVITWF